MTNSPTGAAKLNWLAAGVGLSTLLLATWVAQTLRLPAHVTLIPKLTMILPVDAHAAVWLVISAAVLFLLLSPALIRGRFAVTRGMTVTLLILSAIFLVGLGQEWLGVADQSYRIEWVATVLSLCVELMVFGLVWAAWFIARQRPGLISRGCLNWLLTFYVVNVWCGGGVWLIGP